MFPNFGLKQQTNNEVKQNTKLQITDVGSDILASSRLDGTESGEILTYLKDNGSDRVFNIADEMNMNDKQVISLINKLIKAGYVSVATEQSVVEDNSSFE